jgi:hypothetical protein
MKGGPLPFMRRLAKKETLQRYFSAASLGLSKTGIELEDFSDI